MVEYTYSSEKYNTIINNKNNIVDKIDKDIQSNNYDKNYDTMLIESENVKKQQDIIFLVSSSIAVISVLIVINIIKK